MQQRFVNAGAVLLLGDVTAGGANSGFDFVDCVCRTGWHPGNLSIQHRDVVVIIARRKDVFARDFDQTRQLCERRSFVIIGMTKAQINRVSLVV